MSANTSTLFGLAVVAIFVIVAGGCTSRGAEPSRDRTAGRTEDRGLVILHTNDIHGHVEPWSGWEGELAGKTVGGFDRIASVVRRVRSEEGEGSVLLLDAGDAVGDTMIAGLTKGRAVIDLMNAVGYDAMAVGNHEPDFAAGGLAELQKSARFPLLAANLSRPSGVVDLTPCFVRHVGGVKVGVLGLAYPNTPLTTAKRNVEGLAFVGDPAAVVEEWIPRMRREGAEVIVVLSHLGLGADRALAKTVSGIDVIVGGHSHNRMREAVQVGNTLIVQAGAHGSDVGRLDLTVEGGRVSGHHRTLISLDNAVVESDPETARLMQTLVGQRRDEMNERIGEARSPLVRAQTIAGQEPEKRDRQSPVDSLFADIVREVTRCDVALLPGVGYGVAIPPGPITAASLRNLVPHESKVVTLRLTGEQLKQVLEQSVENAYADDPQKKVGGMIQVSGLRFDYVAEAAAGRRVREVTVNEQPLDPQRRYKVATNSMLADGGHNYRTFRDAEGRREERGQYEMIKGWISEARHVSAPPDQRIHRLSTAGAEGAPSGKPAQ